VAAPDIPGIVADVRKAFATGRTRDLRWRRQQLLALQRLVIDNEPAIAAALDEDLGRQPFEAWLADVASVAAEAGDAAKHVAKWARRKHRRLEFSQLPGRGWIEYEPFGTVLVIGAWNFPFALTLGPAVGAIAAGNTMVLKPSEVTRASSALMAELVPRYLDPQAVVVVEGDGAVSQALIEQGFDKLCFTGGTEIGRKVYQSAAAHLTPVTLELGGKSPVIVADDAKLRVAARRIAFAKLLNSGQTCVAPDYVMVDRRIREPFVAELTKAIDGFSAGPDLPLVNTRQAGRIAGLVQHAGGRTVRGGAVTPDAKRAELTVIVDPDGDSALMREEIFGPVLPIVTVDSVDDAIAHVQQGPKPLAVYLFSESRENERQVLDEISNGATVINQLMYHLLVPGLPFGGVGTSGTGAYHGWWGFETFSHRKAVLRKPSWPDPALGYPPFTRLKERIMRKVF